MPLYLLCTNILVAYVRGEALYQYLGAHYQLSTVNPQPIISVVTEAEVRVIAARNGWGAAKMQRLNALLGYLTVVPIPYGTILDAYVQIDGYSLDNGRQMGKNDLWIAATARSTGATLLTTDQDFDHLHPSWINRVYIDPSSHL